MNIEEKKGCTNDQNILLHNHKVLSAPVQK
jgi:hypothetical protein